MDSNQLCHYGILGMKWGVRRYQNYDGTLTQEGASRLNKHYTKSKSKILKYKTKYSKYEAKANKVRLKADKLSKKGLKEESEKKNKESSKISEKANKYKEKATKWIKALDESFIKINYDSIPKSEINSGKEYVAYVNALQSDLQAKINSEVSSKVLNSLR